MIPQHDINQLRNTLANAYASLDSYLKSDDDKTASQIQLMTVKLLKIVIDNSFTLQDLDDMEP